MFGRRASPLGVANGDVFRRTNGIRVFETAEVVCVSDDRTGIPHVRFRLRVGRADSPMIQAEERTLALSAFLQHFPERT